MFCPKCGTPNVEGAQYCSKCGSALPVATKAPERLDIRCKSCNSIMEPDYSKRRLVCPNCGAVELFVESDAVRIEQLRQEAAKEIEMERIHAEQERSRRQIDFEREQITRNEQMQEQSERYKFQHSALSKAMLIFAAVVILLGLGAFSVHNAISGMLLILGGALSVVAWICGSGLLIFKKFSGLSYLIFALGVISVIVGISQA